MNFSLHFVEPLHVARAYVDAALGAQAFTNECGLVP
jgi:hypothetical protein